MGKDNSQSYVFHRKHPVSELIRMVAQFTVHFPREKKVLTLPMVSVGEIPHVFSAFYTAS